MASAASTAKEDRKQRNCIKGAFREEKITAKTAGLCGKIDVRAN